MHVHTLSEGHWILRSEAVDPIVRRPFQVGDRVVVSRYGHKIFLVDSWEVVCQNRPEYGGRDNTLEDIRDLNSPRDLRPDSGNGSQRPQPGPQRESRPGSHQGVETVVSPRETRPTAQSPPPPGTREEGQPQGGRGRLQIRETIARPRDTRPSVRMLEESVEARDSRQVDRQHPARSHVQILGPIARPREARPKVQLLGEWQKPRDYQAEELLTSIAPAIRPPKPSKAPSPRYGWWIAAAVAALGGLAALLLTLASCPPG